MKCIEDEIPFEVPEGWEWCRLISICSKLIDGDHNPPKGEEYITEYMMLSSTNINHDALVDLKKVRYLSKSIFEKENQRTDVNVGDIFFTSVGSIGRSCVYTGGYNICFQRSVSVIRTLIFNDFLKYYLDAPFIQEKIEQEATGTAQKGFYLNQLSNCLIAVPPMCEQYRIADMIKAYIAIINKISFDNASLQELIKQTKSKILDLAIRGKLVPQDPNDEPAYVLLERIRAEKEELIKQGKIKRDKKESIIFRGDDNSYYEKFFDDKERCIDEELLFELPNGWEWCNLSMIGTTNIGLTYRPTDIIDDGTIVLRSSNIVNDKIDLDDLVRVRTQIRDNQYVQPNDILICARNGSKALVGKCALIGNMEEPASFGAFMAVYRTDYYKYVLHYLRSNLFRNVFNDSNSTAINQLTQDMLKRAVIPFPPFEEQQRIVNLIDKLLLQIKNIERSLN